MGVRGQVHQMSEGFAFLAHAPSVTASGLEAAQHSRCVSRVSTAGNPLGAFEYVTPPSSCTSRPPCICKCLRELSTSINGELVGVASADGNRSNTGSSHGSVGKNGEVVRRRQAKAARSKLIQTLKVIKLFADALLWCEYMLGGFRG